jgi:hypothetical protein
MGKAGAIRWLKVGRWAAFAGIITFGVLAGLRVPEHGSSVMGAFSLFCWALFLKAGRALKN